MIFRSMKDFLKVHWSSNQDFAKVTVIIRYLTVLVIMQIKDKSTRHQITEKSTLHETLNDERRMMRPDKIGGKEI